MAEVLELAQLLQHDGVAEVDVGRRRVEPELDPQLAALARGGLRACARGRPPGSDVDGVAGQEGGVLGGGWPSRPNASVDAPSRRRRAACRDHPAAARRRRAAPRRMSDENGSNITPLFGDREPPEPPRAPPARQEAAAAGHPRAARAARGRLDGLRDDDGRRVRPARPREPQGVPGRAQLGALRRPRASTLGVLTNNQSRVLVSYDDISPVHAQRDHRDRGPALLRELRRRPARHRPRVRPGRRPAARRRRAARRSPSSSSRTRCRPRPSARSSRSCARRRSPTTSRASGPRARSSPSTSTRSTSATAPTAIESAARTYFGNEPDHPAAARARSPCAKELEPDEAALLAGVVASPSGYDPVAHPQAAERAAQPRAQARCSSRAASPRREYRNARQPRRCPARRHQAAARSSTKAPYFTTWVRQQLVDRFGARRAFEGGLQVTTTLDLDLQDAAEQRGQHVPGQPGGPDRGARRDRQRHRRGPRDGRRARLRRRAPFNLATQGQRQPGSAFKPFVLAAALQAAASGPARVWPSRKRVFTVPGTSGSEKFVVNNFESNYAGVSTLAGGADRLRQLGLRRGRHQGRDEEDRARWRERMGIRTPVSTNYAMTLGGLKQGVTPLDMAHAYETFAERRPARRRHAGRRRATGPVGIARGATRRRRQAARATNRRTTQAASSTATSPTRRVADHGHGRHAGHRRRAALGRGEFAAGKTGTTENYGDAWFVGFTERCTVAVWVGYPDSSSRC